MATTTINAGGFWGNVDPKVKKGLIIGFSALIIGGSAIYFSRKAWRKHKADKVLKNAIHEGTLASIVEKLDVAIDGAGTDEEKVYEAFADIPSQNATDRVAKLYNDAYDETLDSALRGDLDTDELQTVKNITASKPKVTGGAPNYNLLDDWIRRLKASSGSWSTDEDGIYRVLWEVPDKKGLALLSDTIKKKTEMGYDGLVAYLTAQLDETEQQHAKYIITRKK